MYQVYKLFGFIVYALYLMKI